MNITADIETAAATSEFSWMTPEERLLVLCARLKLTGEQQSALQSLVELVDWDQVMVKAEWQDLTPLVFHHLSKLERVESIPSNVMGRLKKAYIENSVRNLLIMSEMHRGLKALTAEDVPVILLKGATLAHTVYGDIGLRPMSDIDLLVPEECLFRAQEIVTGMGYRAVGTQVEREDTEKNHRHMPGLAAIGKPVLFEIHRHILRQDNALYFNISGFWSRASEESVGGSRILALVPQDLLIHLAVNFFLDRGFRSVMALRQLCDVAETIKHYQNSIDWEQFLRTVEEYRIAGPVGCSLAMAQGLLGAPVPHEVVDRLWPDGFREKHFQQFLRRRVLDTRPWVTRSLATPGSDYKVTRVAISALRRLIPSRDYLARYNRVSSLGARGPGLYLARIWEGMRILFRASQRPSEMRDDLNLDRWHHSVYGHQESSMAPHNTKART